MYAYTHDSTPGCGGALPVFRRSASSRSLDSVLDSWRRCEGEGYSRRSGTGQGFRRSTTGTLQQPLYVHARVILEATPWQQRRKRKHHSARPDSGNQAHVLSVNFSCQSAVRREICPETGITYAAFRAFQQHADIAASMFTCAYVTIPTQQA